MNYSNTNKRFSPKMVLTIYADSESEYGRKYYLEQRDVVKVNGKVALTAGTPVSEDVLEKVAKSYIKKTAADVKQEGWMPEHLLFGSNKNGKTVVMWYRPAMVRNLNFSNSVIKTQKTTAKVPALLFLVISNKLYIYALMTNSRPDHKTKLYKAPFFNIYSDGNVCLGTADVGTKSSSFEGEADRFERGFFLAEQNGGQSQSNCKTRLSRLWPQLLRTGAAFPSKAELKPQTGYKTVGELIEKLLR